MLVWNKRFVVFVAVAVVGSGGGGDDDGESSLLSRIVSF